MGEQRLLEGFLLGEREGIELRIKYQLEQEKFDFVTLTSASCAAGVLGWYSPALLPETLTASIAVCIGPNTAETAEESGFENILIAQTHTTDGMIDRMLEKVAHEL